MLPMLEGKPSLASQFFGSLGQGLQGGMQTGANYAMQLGLQNAKIKQKQALFNAIKKGGTKGMPESLQPPQDKMDQGFIQALNENAPELEKNLGRDLTSEDLNNLWSKYSGSQTQSQQPQDQTSAFANMSPDEKLQLALAFPTEFNAMAQGERAGLARENLEFEKQKFDTEQESKRYLQRFQEADILRQQLPKRKEALQLFNTSIKQGVGYLSKSNLATIANDLTGNVFNLQPDAPGSMFSYAGKSSLIETLDKVGAKGLNQYLEKQVSRSQPEIGRSQKANTAVVIPMQVSYDIDEHFANTLRDFEESGKFSKGKSYSEAMKDTAKFADVRLKQMAKQLQENEESDQTDEQLLDIGYKGNPKTVEKGTPMTERRAELFLKKYGYIEGASEKDNQKALKTAMSVAKQLGYDIDL